MVSSAYFNKVYSRLDKQYPNGRTALRHKNALEMLVSTILSAQCTDKKVNEVTAVLFKKYKSAKDYANVDLRKFEQEVRQTGFYKNKAKNVKNACKMIVEDFGGKVPSTMEDLRKLPGVARKTANVVLCSAFGKVVGIVVDTHVKRVSQRLGFSKNKTPEKIEQDLMVLVPKDKWCKISFLLIDHGRALCKAPTPKCRECFLKDICPTAPKYL
jgi:endonuclease-3